MSLNLTEAQMNQVRYFYGLSTDEGYENEKRLPCGCSAMFLPVDDKHGVKFYTSEHAAKNSFWWSKILHKMGICPAVWDFGSVTLTTDGHRYGEELWYFHQQRAIVVKSIGQFTSDEKEMRLRALCDKQNRRNVARFGIKNNDAHWGNWGLLGAKLVMIDVGDLAYIPTGNFHDYNEHVYLY